MDLLRKWENTYRAHLTSARWGFKDFAQGIGDIQKQFGQNTSALFSNIFIDGLDNKLATSKEIFANYLTELRNMLIRFAMEEAVRRIFLSVTSAFTTGGGDVITSALVPNLSAAAVQSQGVNISSAVASQATDFTRSGIKMAEGGIVTGPTRALIGESGPEAVIPLSKMGGGGDTYYSTNVYAIDTQSFAEAVRRNPDAIVSVISDNIDSNKKLRRTIRDR